MKKPQAVNLARMLFVLLTLSSCTLRYGQQVNSEGSVPELSFENVHMTRYEDAQPSLKLNASQIEQYKNSSLYAKDAVFTTWDKNQNVETEGSCLLLGMDTKEERYTLFNNILIKNYSENMQIQADSLRWNEKTEQLTSGETDRVTISKEDIQLTGTGFSASGISRQYSFSGTVSGTVTNGGGEQ